jgi:hypothetical protein
MINQQELAPTQAQTLQLQLHVRELPFGQCVDWSLEDLVKVHAMVHVHWMSHWLWHAYEAPFFLLFRIDPTAPEVEVIYYLQCINRTCLRTS